MKNTLPLIALATALLCLPACGDKSTNSTSSTNSGNGASATPDGVSVGPHHGVLAQLSDASGTPNGWIEVKLHDDKGDLEVWLAADKAMASPMDLPSSATLQLQFETQKKVVSLAVRDATENADEDGTPNLRAGKTNYFIFPGDTGEDATWLMGGKFTAKVRANVPGPDGTLTTQSFVLVPHSHGDGHEHGDHGHEHAGGADDHGERVALGKASAGALTVMLAISGKIEAGHEAVLDIEVTGGTPSVVRAWVGIASGRGSLKANVDAEDGGYHGHIEVPSTLAADAAIWVEVELADGSREAVSFQIPK